LAQVPIVWRYEVLRYFRSWRLPATLAVVGALLALMYLIPPLVGESYSGTDANVPLYVEPVVLPPGVDSSSPLPQYVGFLNRSVIVEETLQIFLDGEPYPSADGANWVFNSREDGALGYDSVYFVFNSVLFMEDIGGAEVSATYEWHASTETFDSNFVSFIHILIVICVTFFAADSLVGEFQNKTGYLLFPNAVKRGTLFVGKFSASVTMGVVVVGIYYGVVAVLSRVSVGGVDDDFLLSFLFAVEYMIAATAIAYFISSLLKGTTGAIVLTFFLLFMILPIVDAISMFSGVKLEGSVTFAAGVISSILIDPYPVDSMVDMGMGMEVHSFYPTPGTAAIVMLVYALVACALSMVMFKRKQLAG
jgi:ABC-type transport system involved in multi-copper enzyme maturation permease subunit